MISLTRVCCWVESLDSAVVDQGVLTSVRCFPSCRPLHRGKIQEHCTSLEHEIQQLQESFEKSQTSLEQEKRTKEEYELDLEVKMVQESGLVIFPIYCDLFETIRQ